MTIHRAKALLIILAVVVSYWPAFTAGFVWDDEWYIKGDPSFQGLSGLRRIWTDLTATFQYYPVVHTTFWLEWHLWGAEPMGYHVVNVVLHTLNALLIWALLARLGLRYAWLIGLAFAVHPVTVESVAWVTERKNVLYVFFYLLAMGFFIEAFRLGAVRGTEGASVKAQGPGGIASRSHPRALVMGCAAYLLALLSKTVACTLPAALLLLFLWKKRRLTRGEWLFIVALTLSGGAFAAITVSLERGVVGASGDAWSLGFLERAVVAGKAFWFYLGKIVYPHELTFIYPRWQVGASEPGDYAPLLSMLLLIAGLFAARAFIGLGPLIAVLFFLINVGPALGFFNVYPHRYSFVADHWQYLASVGILTLIATSIGSALRRIGGRAPQVGFACAILCIVVLAGASHSQCRIYKDADTLWRDTVDKNPAAWMAHTNLGVLQMNRDEPDSAIVAFERALRLKPDHHVALNNLAVALARVGRTDEAIDAYEEVLRLQPDYFLALTNLAGLYATHPDPRYRNLDEAERLALHSCRLSNYEHPEALTVLAATYAAGGRFEEAIEIERKTLKIAQDAGAQSMVRAIRQRIEAYRQQLR